MLHCISNTTCLSTIFTVSFTYYKDIISTFQPSKLFFNEEEVLREMELCCARRLLLDFSMGCPYREIQATGKIINKTLFCLR
jgi:hypothetical protein